MNLAFSCTQDMLWIFMLRLVYFLLKSIVSVYLPWNLNPERTASAFVRWQHFK